MKTVYKQRLLRLAEHLAKQPRKPAPCFHTLNMETLAQQQKMSKKYKAEEKKESQIKAWYKSLPKSIRNKIDYLVAQGYSKGYSDAVMED